MRTALFFSLLLLVSSMSYAAKVDGYTGSYEAYVDSAEIQSSRGRFSEAAEYYRKALRKNPGSPLNSKLLANLGMCLSETGRYDEALEALDVAIVREPESVPMLTARAKVLLLADRRSEALSDLDKVLSLDSIASTPLLLRGQLLLMQGDPTKALADFKALLRQYPHSASAAAGAAGCLDLLNDPLGASEYYRQALSVEKNQIWYQGLVASLINAGQTDEAQQEVTAAIEEFPRVGQLYLLRGLIHLLNNRPEDAIADKKTAIVLGIPADAANSLIPLKIPK